MWWLGSAISLLDNPAKTSCQGLDLQAQTMYATSALSVCYSFSTINLLPQGQGRFFA